MHRRGRCVHDRYISNLENLINLNNLNNRIISFICVIGRRATLNQPSQSQAQTQAQTQVDETQPPPPRPPVSSDGAGPSQTSQGTARGDPIITLLRERVIQIEETQTRMEERQKVMDERQQRMDERLQRMEQRQKEMERNSTESLELLRRMAADTDNVLADISFDDV